jgi:GT2 family glycosyltransferase
MSAQNSIEAEPLVTFVILNWNQCDLTLDCLESLGKLEYKNVDVIVVDNGSTDRSVERIHQAFPDYRIISNRENLGYSEGNNVGIRQALEKDSEFIFLLNNDTYADSSMLSRLMDAAIKEPKAGILGPTMFYADPPNKLWGGRNRIDWQKTRVIREQMGETIEITTLSTQSSAEVMYIDSCAILVRSQVFREIGLMDNRFFINFDDIDLCLRTHKAGYKIFYVPSAVIWHRVSAAMGIGSPANTYYMTRNALIFFTRHAPGFLKVISLFRIFFDTIRTIMAWKFKPAYKSEIYQRKRKANVFAMRDFILRRYGKMGSDVRRVCYLGRT